MARATRTPDQDAASRSRLHLGLALRPDTTTRNHRRLRGATATLASAPRSVGARTAPGRQGVPTTRAGNSQPIGGADPAGASMSPARSLAWTVAHQFGCWSHLTVMWRPSGATVTVQRSMVPCSRADSRAQHPGAATPCRGLNWVTRLAAFGGAPAGGDRGGLRTAQRATACVLTHISLQRSNVPAGRWRTDLVGRHARHPGLVI